MTKRPLLVLVLSVAASTLAAWSLGPAAAGTAKQDRWQHEVVLVKHGDACPIDGIDTQRDPQRGGLQGFLDARDDTWELASYGRATSAGDSHVLVFKRRIVD